MTARPLYTSTQEERRDPPGMLEYEHRTITRDLIRMYGFDEARAIISAHLIDEARRLGYDIH